MTFLDTNILVYSVDGKDPVKQGIARKILIEALLTEDLNDGQMYGSVKAIDPF